MELKSNNRQTLLRVCFYILSLFLLVGMMAMIFHFSAEKSTQSSQLSQGVCRRMIQKIVEICSQDLTPSEMKMWVDRIEFPVRKAAHFSEYMLLSILMQMHIDSISKVAEVFPQNHFIDLLPSIIKRKKEWVGVILCIIYAISDEIHQYFVPGRACRFFDVMVDSTGILFGFLLVVLFAIFFRARRRR